MCSERDGKPNAQHICQKKARFLQIHKKPLNPGSAYFANGIVFLKCSWKSLGHLSVPDYNLKCVNSNQQVYIDISLCIFYVCYVSTGSVINVWFLGVTLRGQQPITRMWAFSLPISLTAIKQSGSVEWSSGRTCAPPLHSNSMGLPSTIVNFRETSLRPECW